MNDWNRDYNPLFDILAAREAGLEMQFQVKPPKDNTRIHVQQVGMGMYEVLIYDIATGFQIDERKLLLGEPPHESFTHAARRLAEKDGYTVKEMTAEIILQGLPTYRGEGVYLADRFYCLMLSCPNCGSEMYECDGGEGIQYFNTPDRFICTECKTQLEPVKLEDIHTKWIPIWIANGR